jgi:hypothetical protein
LANETDTDMFDTLNATVGWHKLMRAKPTVEAMVIDAEPEPLQLGSVDKFLNRDGAFLGFPNLGLPRRQGW